MKAIVGLVLAGKILLSLAIGVRLLAMNGESRLSPERCLGLHMLLGGGIGGSLIVVAYAIWSSGSQAPWIGDLHAVGRLFNLLGTVALLAFTERTFRPDTPWARALLLTLSGMLVLAYLGRIAGEGFAISVSPGPLHWVSYAVRMVTLSWVTIESVSYWKQMRRRQRLGLAKAVLVNRFLLWSVWGGGTLLAALSEPIARVIYALVVGDAHEQASIIGVAQPIILISLSLTSVTGIVTSVALFLTFFPTQGYRRWIEAGRPYRLAAR